VMKKSRILRVVCSAHQLTKLLPAWASSMQGEGQEWVRGFGILLVVCTWSFSYTCGPETLVVSGIWQAKNRFLKSINRILITWSRHRFRNRPLFESQQYFAQKITAKSENLILISCTSIRNL
jgi:hypothetical protein